MKTTYQNSVKIDSFTFNNYKLKESQVKMVLLQSQSTKKFGHKKGSLSCLTSYSQLKETNINSSIQIEQTELKKFVPKFLQNKSTLHKQIENSNLLKYPNQNQPKKIGLFNKFQKLNRYGELNRDKSKLEKSFSQQKDFTFIKVNKQKALQKRFNIDQVYEIKEKIKKIRDQVVLNNFNKIPLSGYNLKTQNNQFKNNQKSQLQTAQLKKSNGNGIRDLPKTSLSIKDFELLQSLGSGVYGQVSLYRHLKTNFIVAIKKISKRSLDSQNESIYLSRQIKIHSSAEHPNIVQLYTFFDDSSNIYLLMEVCNQGNLLTILQRQGGKLPEQRVRRYIRNVSKALEFLHDQNIIHRDIKPENILVSNGIAKLCDFGWSINTFEKRATLCGTPLYSSPQIVKSQEYDNKVDIWCIGIMTYQLIYGRTPFQIRSREDLMKVVNCQVYFPSCVQVSEECKDFINGCLKKNAQQRFEIEDVLGHLFLRDDQKIRDSLKASLELNEKRSNRS